MNGFAEARLNNAIEFIDCVLESEPDGYVARMLQSAKGELAAMKQLVELQDEIADGQADTERPASLRLVK